MSQELWADGVIVIGCRDNTAEFVESLLCRGCRISGIVTISQRAAEKNHVPLWADLKAEFGLRMPVYVSENYSLSGETDRGTLAEARASAGFCIGWQRLLPAWFLQTCHNGVFGMHACANRLPNGRGRSPINWSVIEGARSLFAHIFRYNDQPDAGDLLSAPLITVEPHDDIQTLQQKARVVFVREIVKHWQELTSGTVRLRGLNESGETERFYPKRTEDDGLIDWSQQAGPITDWIRAQTRPYPGAFTMVDGRRCPVWRAGPTGIEYSESPGTLLERFRDGTWYVQCGASTSLHLLDHELPSGLTTGRKLGT